MESTERSKDPQEVASQDTGSSILATPEGEKKDSVIEPAQLEKRRPSLFGEISPDTAAAYVDAWGRYEPQSEVDRVLKSGIQDGSIDADFAAKTYILQHGRISADPNAITTPGDDPNKRRI